MNDPIALLIQLQALDLKRQQDKEGLERIPEKIRIAEEPLLDTKAMIEKAQASLENVNKEKKDKEFELQTIEDKIVKLKLRQSDLKTNKEYHAHLQEIAAANKEREDTEDRLLQTMEESDLLKKELASKEATLKEEETQFLNEQKRIKEDADQLSRSDRKLEQEWQALSKDIPNDLIESYKKLCAQQKGLAVVPVNGYICTGCNFSLPPQLIAEVKKREHILNCNYCHRMLYVELS